MRVLEIAGSCMKMAGLKIIYGKKIVFKGITLFQKNSSVQIGKGSKVKIGNRTTLGSGTLVAARNNSTIDLGLNVYMNRNCTIVAHEAISIGDGATIGPNCCIYDHDHDTINRGKYITNQVSIGKKVWIGAGCIILKGVTIGDNSVIAAGTLLSKSVPENSIVREDKHIIIKEQKLSDE